MNVRHILRIAGQIRYLKSTIREYGDSLKKGKYFMYGGYRAVAHDSAQTIKCANVYFDKFKKTGKLDNLALKVNKTSYLCNSNKNSSEEYEAIYTANNYDKNREVKLFSFEQSKILTICTSEYDMKKQLEQYEKFGWAYNMPRVTPRDKYPNSYEIDMVDIKAAPDDVLALKEIASSTIKFNPSPTEHKTVSVKKLIEFDYPDGEMRSLLEGLVSKIDSSVLETEIPLCIQHGDLSKDNLIYGTSENKEGFWWIDWEHARERVFFYDYFFYVINSVLYFDDKAFKSYNSQESDAVLGELFNHFGLTFESEKKKDYFLVFAIVFLKERVCEAGRLTALKKYFSLICEKFI